MGTDQRHVKILTFKKIYHCIASVLEQYNLQYTRIEYVISKGEKKCYEMSS